MPVPSFPHSHCRPTSTAYCSDTPSTMRCARTYAPAAASRPSARPRRTADAFFSVFIT